MKTQERVFEKAKEAIKSRDKLKELLTSLSTKLKSTATNSEEWKELRSKIMILKRMVEVQLSGEYRAFPVSSMLLVVFALIYFITPTDIVTDFIPALGFTDDASVAYLIIRKLDKDIRRFLSWSGEE
ncbi:MAG: YkvA family protein [Bacteroidota bacterium]